MNTSVVEALEGMIEKDSPSGPGVIIADVFRGFCAENNISLENASPTEIQAMETLFEAGFTEGVSVGIALAGRTIDRARKP